MIKTGKALASITAAGALTGGLLFFAAGTAAAGTHMCGVPEGKTWDYVMGDSRCGIVDGWAYDVIDPAEGVWACSVPAGWTYTATQSVTYCSQWISPSTKYKLTRA